MEGRYNARLFCTSIQEHFTICSIASTHDLNEQEEKKITDSEWTVD